METETQETHHIASQKRSYAAHHPRRIKWLVRAFAVLVVAAIVAGAFWCGHGGGPLNSNKSINTKEYQAVFLTNGQVYFGRVTNLNGKYVTLTNIYYLQVQQTNGSLQNASSSANADSQVSLAKLGSELHGPEDKMYIASDQMLFWENLKSDSKVVQAITKYQNQ